MGFKNRMGQAARKGVASQPSMMDIVRGTTRSVRTTGLVHGTNPFAVRKYAKQVKSEREFGSGSSGGGRNWTAPVHASLDNGRPITISFGIGNRAGHYLVADGHVTMQSFYDKANEQRHDHFKNGKILGDRRAST